MTNRISSAAFAQAKDLYLKSVRLGREALAARTAMVTVLGLDDEDDIDTFYEKQVRDTCSRAEKAEAALAELRGRVEKAVEKLQWDIDHPATMGHDRGEIIAVLTHPTTPVALLTDPEAKEGGGPDTHVDDDGRTADRTDPNGAEPTNIAQPARDTAPVPALLPCPFCGGGGGGVGGAERVAGGHAPRGGRQPRRCDVDGAVGMTDHKELAATLAEMTGGFDLRRDAIEAALTDAYRRGEESQPKVKPLEWHRHSRDDIERYSADPPFAQYIITWTAGGYDIFIGFWGSAAEPRPPFFATLEAAKAAAQADYEKRILSALDLPPRSPNEQETET